MGISRILVKDGGFATQLTLHTTNMIDGGADIILTNTYQASIEGYMKYLKLDRKSSVELIKSSVRLAQISKDIYLRECFNTHRKVTAGYPLLMASIGPFGAHLHDGSEYSGKYANTVSARQISDWHRVRINACFEAGINAFAIETIPCQMEAEALVAMLCDDYPDVKFWIAFQCKDGRSLAHGENFRDVVLSIWKTINGYNAVHNCIAIGVNCVNPKNVTQLFKCINDDRTDRNKIPLIAYPNSGEVYDITNGWTGQEHCIPLENYVQEWADLGAKVIGGCCRTYATDVYKIANVVWTLSQLNIAN